MAFNELHKVAHEIPLNRNNRITQNWGSLMDFLGADDTVSLVKAMKEK